jgi:hypothetical protein
MAGGTITVSNFSEKSMNVRIVGGTQSMVASGTLPVGQTSGYLVSGFDEYQVNFYTSDSSGNVTASNVAPDSTVQFAIEGG